MQIICKDGNIWTKYDKGLCPLEFLPSDPNMSIIYVTHENEEDNAKFKIHQRIQKFV